jgi:hypothetical protein
MQDGAPGVSLGEILKERVAEIRAMRVFLESIDKKLKAVCEIAEASSISFHIEIRGRKGNISPVFRRIDRRQSV